MRSLFALSFLALLVWAALPAAPAAEAKAAKTKKAALPPRHDPPDIPFRRAPMSNAVRTVHIPLATNLHLAFDTELLRTHTVWQGDTLNLWGAVYHAAKDKFYCDFNGQVLWTLPPLFPWVIEGAPQKISPAPTKGHRFLGLSTTAGLTTLRYELTAVSGERISIEETPGAVTVNDAPAVVRHLKIGPSTSVLSFLVHVGPATQSQPWRLPDSQAITLPANDSSLVAVARGLAGLKFYVRTQTLTYEELLWAELKNDSEMKRIPRSHEATLVWLQIPPHAEPLSIEVFSVTTRETGALSDTRVALDRFLRHQPPTVARVGSQHPPQVVPGDKNFLLPGGDESYRVEHFPVPKEIELLVTGMDFLPNGDLAVCTWLGDVYIVEKPTGALAAAKYRRFARGLCEPGGLKVIEGDIYVVQKQELTRLKDTDGNGEADLFECISQHWGFTGNYHDFTFGPTLDRDGNFHLFRNGNRGLYDVPFMGWDIVVSRDGRTVTPFCAGLRSPNGFGTYAGEIWMTENQGNWMGACKLNNLRAGRFYGYPSTSPAPKDKWFDTPTEFSPPAVWFPYSLAKSASGIAVIEDDRFGPFRGQMLVGEFQNATVTRVFLEQVNGEWQGCVWPFAKGFYSGVNRLSFGPDGKLYVGGCKNAAWAAVAPKDYSLDRVSFTGKVPFEIAAVRAHRDGFELTFTQPVDAATAGKADNWDVSQYRYEYHQTYGSPEFDFDGKPNSASEVTVVGATVSADGLKVKLKLDGWRAGYVAAIRALDVTNTDGKPLRHETCWYTLNQIPK
jgi:glucose/arabinose dehydrogenase